MTSLRTRLALIATIATLAALHASHARGGLFRAGAVFSVTGDAGLACVADAASNPQQQGSAGPPCGKPDETEHEPPCWEQSTDPGTTACNTTSWSQSSGGGLGVAACGGSEATVPPLVPGGRLPTDMGPAFCNPPPGKLLRPPRG